MRRRDKKGLWAWIAGTTAMLLLLVPATASADQCLMSGGALTLKVDPVGQASEPNATQLSVSNGALQIVEDNAQLSCSGVFPPTTGNVETISIEPSSTPAGSNFDVTIVNPRRFHKVELSGSMIPLTSQVPVTLQSQGSDSWVLGQPLDGSTTAASFDPNPADGDGAEWTLAGPITVLADPNNGLYASGAGNEDTEFSEAAVFAGPAPVPLIISNAGGNAVSDFVGGAANDVITGGNADDGLSGGGGADTISGGAGRDTIHGDDGNDRLFGGAGRDRLFGGPGRDRLRGGPAHDRLAGGPGRDNVKQ